MEAYDLCVAHRACASVYVNEDRTWATLKRPVEGRPAGPGKGGTPGDVMALSERDWVERLEAARPIVRPLRPQHGGWHGLKAQGALLPGAP